MVTCRFAPSPTGKLHLGGARTALFNWAFARHNNGKFLLRIEDTDQERSKPEFEDSILQALDWLGMKYDDEIVRQSTRLSAYQEIAQQLLDDGLAYRCYATAEELDQLRKEQIARKEKPRYDRRWRERTDYPANQEYCIRFKTPIDGECQITDLIRNKVTVPNKEFDDPVILRADKTATYNFAAVVDDAYMKITHVIRGEDHLTNTLRQVHIHQALNHDIPIFAHLPLIMGRKLDEDGNPIKKDDEFVYERLSKRNMVVDVDQYRSDGFIPAGMINYLAQLGWTQPNTEIYTADELIQEFDLSKVNKSAARFDLDRLRWINQKHMQTMSPEKIANDFNIIAPIEAIAVAMEKAKTINEIKDDLFWLVKPNNLEASLLGHLTNENKSTFVELINEINSLKEFTKENIKGLIKTKCKENNLKFPQLGMPLRVSLTGKEQSPDVAFMAQTLGPEEVKERLAVVLNLIN